jgi:site-specific recombinase XerD
MEKQKFHILSREEQSHLLDTLYHQGKIRDSALIHLCLQTGLCNAEACALNNDHLVKFDTVVSVFDIDAEITFAQQRQLPLADSVRAALTTYQKYAKFDISQQQLEPAVEAGYTCQSSVFTQKQKHNL